VAAAAEAHNPGRPRGVSFGSVAQKREKQVSEQEGADVVGSKSHLDAFSGRLARGNDEPSIIDKNIERGRQRSNIGSGLTNGRLRREVQPDSLDPDRGVQRVHLGNDLGQFGLCSRSQDQEAWILRRESERCCEADSKWADAGDQNAPPPDPVRESGGHFWTCCSFSKLCVRGHVDDWKNLLQKSSK